MRYEAAKALKKQNKAFSKAMEAPVVALYHYNGCGFFDGGCLLLADALNIWSSGQIQLAAMGRSRFKGLVDHWVGSFGVAGQEFFIDANGVQTQKALLRYWEEEELMETSDMIDSPAYDPERGIPRDLEFSKQLAGQLETALGSFKQWLIQLDRSLDRSQEPSSAQ